MVTFQLIGYALEGLHNGAPHVSKREKVCTLWLVVEAQRMSTWYIYGWQAGYPATDKCDLVRRVHTLRNARKVLCRRRVLLSCRWPGAAVLQTG